MTPLPSTREAHSFGPLTVWLGAKSGKFPDCNQITLRGSDTHVALDASRSSSVIGPDFDDADLVILTHVHEDHVGGLRPDTPVQAPIMDLPALHSWEGAIRAWGVPEHLRAQAQTKIEEEFFFTPRPDATGYDVQASWDLGGVKVQALHLPGHTPGHSGLLIEPLGIAFIADIDLSRFGPYYGDETSSLKDFRASIAKVAQIEADVFVTGHHRGIYTDRKKMLGDLASYLNRIEIRSGDLLSRLRQEPRSLPRLIEERLIYPRAFWDIHVDRIERVSILMHLEELIEAGEVRFDRETGLYHG